MNTGTEGVSRRPLKSRSAAWAKSLASQLGRVGVAPNAISGLSIFFASGGALCLAATGLADVDGSAWLQRMLFLGGAVGIQLRLVCNLMDGMVAVEGNPRSPTGELWNEIPDRFADAFLLTGAGFAVGMPLVGLVAAIGAIFTAYLRALGASLTGTQDFAGPMAKPHRMAVLTVAAAGGVFAPGFGALFFKLALGAILVGLVLTCGMRIARLARQLHTKA